MEYQAKCRVCGHMNTELLLDDSHGYFECEKCRTVNRVVMRRCAAAAAGERHERSEMWQDAGNLAQGVF